MPIREQSDESLSVCFPLGFPRVSPLSRTTEVRALRTGIAPLYPFGEGSHPIRLFREPESASSKLVLTRFVPERYGTFCQAVFFCLSFRIRRRLTEHPTSLANAWRA